MTLYTRVAATRNFVSICSALVMTGTAPIQFALATVSVGALSVALPFSASAATCITSVTPTFTDVVASVDASKGKAITAVTPGFGDALTSVDTTTKTGKFLTGASLDTKTGSAVTNVSAQTGTFLTSATLDPQTGKAVTSVTPQTQSVSVITNGSTTNVLKADGFYQDGMGDVVKYPNPPGIHGLNSDAVVPVVTGDLTNTNVVTGITSDKGDFLTADTSINTNSDKAVTGIHQTTDTFVRSASLNSQTGDAVVDVKTTSQQGKFVNKVDTQQGDFLTSLSSSQTSVVSNVTADNSGASASATSLGCGVNATANGANSTALGTNANAGNSDNATAVGAGSTAGTNAVALGTNSRATGTGSTAVGYGAKAEGANSTAIGNGASTGSYTNATAIGAGATATRNNQVMIGTASNTYTAPGITSNASRAAQSGPLQVVTTDAGGNLASDGGYIFNNLNTLNNTVYNLSQDIRRLDGGVAMAMALGGVYLPEHQNVAVHANLGFYNDALAVAFQGVLRINETLTANGGIAFDTSGRGGVGGRVGISAGW